jgi:hypothetical protein
MGAEAMSAAVEAAMQKAAQNPLVPFAKRQMEAVRTEIISTAKTQEELNAGLETYYQLLDQYARKYSQLSGLDAALMDSPRGDEIRQQRLEADTNQYKQNILDLARMAIETERQVAAERAQSTMDAANKVIAIEQEMATKRRAVQDDFRQESVDIERQRGRDMQLEAMRAAWASIDQERQIAQQRAAIQAQYQKAVAQAAEQFARAQAQAAQQYARQQVEIERAYQRQIADIQQRYAEDEFEATLNRDAVALFRAQRQRDQSLADAQENRDEHQQQATQQYQDALAAAQQARADSLAQAQQAQAESLAQLEASTQAELEAKRRAEERARQEQALQLQFQEQDRAIYMQRRYAQIAGEYAAELQAAQNYYINLVSLETSYQASRIRSQATGTARAGRPTAYQ